MLCKVKDELREGFETEDWLNKRYRIKDGYKWLQGSMEKVNWYDWVWNHFNIPKHTFINWLSALDRLRTRDKLVQFGVCDSTECLLCGEDVETSNHLFFACSYSAKVIDDVAYWLGLHNSLLHSLNNWKNWKERGKNSIQQRVALACLSAVVYNIWMARNHALWYKVVLRPDLLSKGVKREVVTRCQQMINHTWKIEDCLVFPEPFLEGTRDLFDLVLVLCSCFKPFLEGGKAELKIMVVDCLCC
ncbi:uncharacterized protein LOC110732114 [Chenopodium quinoa]|uniref:uncharacterized protein LOC110732114 n=1 Tax=Chenopodium quinoa TaxID=63459 RepID=UPI000B77F250|nr:uncharacterized protein LOC110732114 [Chenopodium quinoa]